jgi:hypothetical protein
VPWWTWIALGVFALAIAATGIFSVWAFGRVKVLQASGEALAMRLEDLSRQAEELQRRGERVSVGAEELQRRMERIDRSVGDLRVLGWAVGDTRRSLMRLRKTYLRK